MGIEGKRILNTRPADRSEEFSRNLRQHGAEVIDFPVVEIQPAADNAELDSRLRSLNKYDGLIFSSSHAVQFFFEHLESLDIHFMGRIFAVGAKTKQKIEGYGYKVTFVPDRQGAANLAKAISSGDLKNNHFLFPRGNLSLTTLRRTIKNVDEFTVYNNVKPANNDSTVKIRKQVLNNEINCVAFFSPSAVENFLDFLKPFKQNGIQVAVIGSTTSRRARALGLDVNIEAQTPSAESLADGIINYYNGK